MFLWRSLMKIVSSKLAILGAGGHSKVIHDIATKNNYTKISFFDDKNTSEYIKGGTDLLLNNQNEYDSYFIAIGNNLDRKKMKLVLSETTMINISLIHPRANVSDNVLIEEGVCVMAGATINAFSIIGEGSIINTNASIDHDCTIGKYNHVCPGVNIAGTVKTGDEVFIGIGSNLINNISISPNTKIKAGTTVIKSI